MQQGCQITINLTPELLNQLQQQMNAPPLEQLNVQVTDD